MQPLIPIVHINNYRYRMRVPDISIRNGAESPNNCVHGQGDPSWAQKMRQQKAICERLVLVLGWHSAAEFVAMPSASVTPLPAHSACISPFLCLKWPVKNEIYLKSNTHIQHVGYTDVSPGVRRRRLEGPTKPDGLNRHICVRIWLQSTHVYMYAERRNKILD